MKEISNNLLIGIMIASLTTFVALLLTLVYCIFLHMESYLSDSDKILIKHDDEYDPDPVNHFNELEI